MPVRKVSLVVEHVVKPRQTARLSALQFVRILGCKAKRIISDECGQSSVEYAILTAGIIIPVTFGIIYLAQILWIWHSVTDFTRDGARYAATHCWQAGGGNVSMYMQSNVPLMIDQDQFKNGNAQIQVDYFAKDPSTGTLTDFTCDTECSTSCVPDAVTVRVLNYQFRSFMSYLGLQPVSMPDFRTSVPIEGAGCDPDLGVCQP